MKALNGIEIGTLHRDGTVTDPNNLVWTETCEGFMSQRLHNGNWPYYLFIKLIDMEDAAGEEGFLVEIVAASPRAAGKKNVDKAIESSGISDDVKLTPELKAQLLADYGCAASLWNKYDKTAQDGNILLAEAKKEAEAIQMLFGFYMDKPENMMGATGWDFIRGNLVPKNLK